MAYRLPTVINLIRQDLHFNIQPIQYERFNRPQCRHAFKSFGGMCPGCYRESINKYSNPRKNKKIVCKSSKICAICRDSFIKDPIVKRLPCRHVFHAICIDKWLARNNSCPICRFCL
jgi:hypothetical protein